jgi:hypothetical protein
VVRYTGARVEEEPAAFIREENTITRAERRYLNKALGYFFTALSSQSFKIFKQQFHVT